MLAEPECYTRNCLHFGGVIEPDGTEESETNVCMAFPEGIPIDIAYGNNKHTKVFPGQTNDIVFEQGLEE